MNAVPLPRPCQHCQARCPVPQACEVPAAEPQHLYTDRSTPLEALGIAMALVCIVATAAAVAVRLALRCWASVRRYQFHSFPTTSTGEIS